MSGGSAYIIVVNTQNSPLNGASFTVTSVQDGSAEVYDEGRTVTVSGGAITDDFETYGVHIYVIPVNG